MVYRAITEYLRKQRVSQISFDNLYKALPALSQDDIDRAVKDLDEEQKIHVERRAIHLV
jgi:hypothetical protein